MLIPCPGAAAGVVAPVPLSLLFGPEMRAAVCRSDGVIVYDGERGAGGRGEGIEGGGESKELRRPGGVWGGAGGAEALAVSVSVAAWQVWWRPSGEGSWNRSDMDVGVWCVWVYYMCCIIHI